MRAAQTDLLSRNKRFKILVLDVTSAESTFDDVFQLRLFEIAAVRDPCLQESLSLMRFKLWCVLRLLKQVRHVSFQRSRSDSLSRMYT